MLFKYYQGRIVTKNQGTLLACGAVKDGIGALDISQFHNGDTTSLIGDSLKNYRIKSAKKEFIVEEALNQIGEFKPIFEVKVSCSEKACQAVDQKCVWKKSSVSENDVNKLLARVKRGGENTDVAVTEMFKAALNGNATAKKFFAGQVDVGSNATASEVWDSHSQDLKRFEKLKCK